ncbi:NADH-quinone oxidoreductase subunit L [Paludibacterium sp. B53371]|uniref:NADH-quinone oxidoreductase subunit L n=1 Tax=Paludibacterium sp. B53371 TaxID=2806263 RepID=UPI001C045B46|nr:NADH-quinone oxidoreductase subunit L [Paludibacterium sp. B53371]
MPNSLSLLALLPLSYLLAGALLPVFRRDDQAWSWAEAISLLALFFVLAGAWPAWLAAQGVMVAVSLLIALLGWVIVRYSRRYLRGEPGQRRYLLAMLWTLAGAATVVQTDHLLWLALAWTATSLTLHRLLLFYPRREAAQVAAHKKFIASRLADVCLWLALTLIYQQVGSGSLAALSSELARQGGTPGLQLAAILLVFAVCLKTAQLPVHGWLLQVMEAPTPVSALLHAGVVNLGGVVLIRLAPLLEVVPLAQWLLVLVGSLTASVAGLVMMTRVSIKLRLAWSTCAQMGFMLLECGLGWYSLALLHLLAHSLYKAHAFLSAGEVLQHYRQRQGWPALSLPGWPWLCVVPLLLFVMLLPTGLPAPLCGMLSLGLAPCLWQVASPSLALWGGLRVAGLLALYLLWHAVFGQWLPHGLAPEGAAWWAVAWLTLLYGLQSWLACHPAGRLAQWLYPRAYGGFYLDEWFTRLTFRLWPLARPLSAGERP